jgi:phosphoribosyl 1,2-cyclic phosphodiesterase
MILTVLGSSSSGNGYIIHNGNEALILEAGVRFSTAKKALDFNTSIITGVLVSHIHRDHSKYVEDYLKAGIMVLADKSVFQEMGTKYSYLCKEVLPGQGYKVGNFKVVPFHVQHDVPCNGFLIDHPETGRILFLTDSFMTEYTFPGLSHILIEANYADDILESNIIAGLVHPSMRPRLLQTHMEIETCKSILQVNDLSRVINIILVHLSSQNSNEERFVREVRECTGKQVYAAKRGLKLEINNNPY